MIKINDKHIDQQLFPDSTPLLKFTLDDVMNHNHVYEITWLYRDMQELFNLICIVDKIRKYDEAASIKLICPYLPNARMDRVKNPEDTFTLFSFCKIINSLKLDEVRSFDVHSNVSKQFLNNFVDEFPGLYISQSIMHIKNLHLKEDKNLTLFFPDEGAMKRYKYAFDGTYKWGYGVKERDWNSGVILGLNIEGLSDKEIKGQNFLIIDDICSKGGTFYYSALKLKELGANQIFLYVSHCERSIFDGKLLKSDLIDHIFTTNSIYHDSSKKITAFQLW